MFKCFPLTFCSRNLEQIDKRHCNLTVVPDDVLRYTRTLEELLLDANQLQDLPKGVYRLTQLRRLTFSDNEIQRILPEIGQLVNLEELDSSRNDIAEIPDNIRHCRSLQKLDFSGNPLTHNLPPGIIHLRQLSQLILNDVSLAELPREIGSLLNLRVLEIRENLLKVLPDSIVQLIRLESLDVGSNAIEQLPAHIGHLQSLKELWLDSNELVELPNDIGQLQRLQCLDVSENRLTSLPPELGDLESLTNLELSSNQVEQLPATIGRLKHRLLILKINSNSLNKLCEEIGQCSALTELILTENALTELPTSIGELKNLTNLNIDRNQLTHLPDEIAGCESLGMLSLRDNRLTAIPSELSKLKQLHVLDLSGNRLANLPCTLLECDLKAIWLAENQAQPMLKFATDIDPHTGEKVLTCYLLPQQQYSTSSMENLLNTPKCQTVSSETPVARPLTQSPFVRQTNSLDDDRHERAGSVKFADQAEENKESSLQRHNTPHPKDLRSWRNKMAKKLHMESSAAQSDPQHASQTNAHARTGSAHPSVSSGSSTIQNNRSVTKNATAVARDSIDYIPPDLSLDDQPDSENERDGYPGDHTAYIEKHVEFTDNLHRDEDDGKTSATQQRLHRRDTPHHLKNKRILNSENHASVVGQTILHSPTKSSMSSGRKDSISPSLPSNSRSTAMQYDQITVLVHRSPNTGLGISIAGGMGSSAYKENDHGIFLTKVTREGPAGQAGLLVGDKLLTVNGISLLSCEHTEAVSALKRAGDQFEVVVQREVLQSPADESNADESRSLTEPEPHPAIAQRGDKQSAATASSARTTNGNDNRYMSKTNTSSSLASGDRFLSTNGHDTANVSYDQVDETIHPTSSDMQSTLYREKITNGGSDSTMNIVDNTIEEARVLKGNGPMGLSIVGGTDQACPPFGMEQRGVFVSKILPSGSASRTNLRIGDRILKVNNQDITQATHAEAVQALLQPTHEVVLLVRHDPQPAGLRELALTKQSNEALGIRINGGIDGKRMNPDDPDDDGIFVTEVKENSPASGLLTIGTRILEVSNQSLFGARLDDAQKWLSAPDRTIQLLVCDGFHPRETVSLSNSNYGLTKKSKANDVLPPAPPPRPILTQKSISPAVALQPNGILNSCTPLTTPSQAPPVPAKPKFRPLQAQVAPANGDSQKPSSVNHPNPPRIQPQNGFEVDESDMSISESERSFNDKKKFFESGFKDAGPKPKPRQFKYINEHELVQMRKEDEQKVKTMSPTELRQSRTMDDNDHHESQQMHTSLSQYQTPTYLAKPEDDDDIVPQRPPRHAPSTSRVTSLERDTASAHTMLSKVAIESGST